MLKLMGKRLFTILCQKSVYLDLLFQLSREIPILYHIPKDLNVHVTTVHSSLMTGSIPMDPKIAL